MYIAAGWEVWRWFTYWNNIYFEQRQRAKAVTPASFLAEKLQGLSDKALSIMEYEIHGKRKDDDAFRNDITIVTDANGNEHEIQNGFLLDFLLAAEGTELPAVRDYSSGSKDRKYAQVVTDYLIAKGAAIEPSGPYSARITTWPDVSRALGWSD